MTGPDRGTRLPGTEYAKKGDSTAEPEVKVGPRRGNLYFWIILKFILIGFEFVQEVRLASGLVSDWL
jgi:hypothetical protein